MKLGVPCFPCYFACFVCNSVFVLCFRWFLFPLAGFCTIRYSMKGISRHGSGVHSTPSMGRTYVYLPRTGPCLVSAAKKRATRLLCFAFLFFFVFCFFCVSSPKLEVILWADDTYKKRRCASLFPSTVPGLRRQPRASSMLSSILIVVFSPWVARRPHHVFGVLRVCWLHFFFFFFNSVR